MRERYTAKPQQCPGKPPQGLRILTADGRLTAEQGHNVTFLVQLEEVGSVFALHPGPRGRIWVWFMPRKVCEEVKQDGVMPSRSGPGCSWVEFALKCNGRCMEMEGLSERCGAQGNIREKLIKTGNWFNLGISQENWRLQVQVLISTFNCAFCFLLFLELNFHIYFPLSLNQRWKILHVQLGPHHTSWYMLFRHLWVKSQDVLSSIKSEIHC